MHLHFQFPYLAYLPLYIGPNLLLAHDHFITLNPYRHKIYQSLVSIQHVSISFDKAFVLADITIA